MLFRSYLKSFLNKILLTFTPSLNINQVFNDEEIIPVTISLRKEKIIKVVNALYDSLRGFETIIELACGENSSLYKKIKKSGFKGSYMTVDYGSKSGINQRGVKNVCHDIFEVECVSQHIQQHKAPYIIISSNALNNISPLSLGDTNSLEKLAAVFNAYPANLHIHIGPYQNMNGLKIFMINKGWVVIQLSIYNDIEVAWIFVRKNTLVPYSFAQFLKTLKAYESIKDGGENTNKMNLTKILTQIRKEFPQNNITEELIKKINHEILKERDDLDKIGIQDKQGLIDYIKWINEENKKVGEEIARDKSLEKEL